MSCHFLNHLSMWCYRFSLFSCKHIFILLFYCGFLLDIFLTTMSRWQYLLEMTVQVIFHVSWFRCQQSTIYFQVSSCSLFHRKLHIPGFCSNAHFFVLDGLCFFFSDQIQPFLLQLDDLNEYNLQMVPGNDASLTVSLGHLTWLSCEMWGTIYVDYWMIVCTLTF